MKNTLTEKYKIADENNRQISAFRPLPAATLKSLREYYRVGLTYTSNAIEGNSLTESETKVVIEDGLTIEGKPLRDVYEAVGHAKAYDYLLRLLKEDDTANDTVNDTVKTSPLTLTTTETAVLRAITEEPGATYERLAEKCGVSRPTVARSVKHLQQQQLIRRIGSDKTGHWEITM